RLHVRIDERVAGFTALGIARETRRPAAVICTSGTAAANLLPAALEAHHSGVPLILLTADRPPELRGVGANQTTRQPGMFSPNVRWEADLPVPDAVDDDGSAEQTGMLRGVADEAVAAALGAGARQAGPVHLNVPFREPLAGALPPWFGAALTTSNAAVPPRGDETASADTAVDGSADLAGAEPSGAHYQGGGGIGEADQPGSDGDPLVLERGVRTIVVAGSDAGPAAEELAHQGGWPLVAEIVSGSRFGRHVVHGYRALLRDADLGGRVERAVVFGHPTLSREVVALLSRDDVEVIAVRGPGEPLNLNGATGAADAVVAASGETDREWLGAWMRASRAAAVDLSPPAPDADGLASAVPSERLGAIAAELGALRAPLDRETLVDAVWRASWPHDRLLFGSSRLVRVADAVLPGKKVPVHANRGLAGIDGTVATGLGIALASQAAGAPGVTRVLLGDLALLHDAGSLLLPPGEQRPRVQVIVGNDGGGTIFDGLEVASVAGAAAMDRVLYTPHQTSLAQLAAAYGWEHLRVETRSALDQALTAPVTAPQLIEVPLPR
ncbi:MAG: 2-succinyl-5-enolpyruvyl-6-hydroxy-3-cyclohexene-1-carboxylic-acid synthase, partial [Microbacterium sp.]